MNIISAASARGDFRFMTHDGTVDPEVFRDFLKRLIVGAKQPIILVVDGYPTHKSKVVREYVESQEGKLKLVVLPAYSPQLNPDEQVWAWVKARVARQLHQKKETLEQIIIPGLQSLQKPSYIVQPSSRTQIVNMGPNNISFQFIKK